MVFASVGGIDSPNFRYQNYFVASSRYDSLEGLLLALSKMLARDYSYTFFEFSQPNLRNWRRGWARRHAAASECRPASFSGLWNGLVGHYLRIGPGCAF